MRGLGILQLLVLLLFCACSEDDQLPENTGTILCSITSDNGESLNGRLIFDRAYVHLTRIEVNIYRDNSVESTSQDFDGAQQFFFIGSDPGQPIPLQPSEATFMQPGARFFFAPDSYVLYVKDTVYGEPTDGNGDGEAPDSDGEENSDDDADDDDHDNGEDDGVGEDDDGDDDGTDDDDGDDSDKDDGDGKDKDKDKDKGDKDDKDKDKGDKDHKDDDGGRTGETGKTVDLSDFLLHAKPPLVLLGTYIASSDTIRVIVSVEMNSLDVHPIDTAELSIKSSDEISATIVFNPGDWFDVTFETNIANADFVRYRDQKILLIHKDFNSELYQSIQDKITSTTRLEFSIRGNSDGL